MRTGVSVARTARGQPFGPGRWSTAEWTAIAGLTVLVAGVSAYRLGHASFRIVEGATWAISGRGFEDLVEALADRELPAGGLYLVLAHGWMRVWGDSEAAIRGLSAIFAALTVPMFYAVARRVLDGAPARAGALALLVLSPYFFSFAREARMYSLALLLATASTYCFLRVTDPNGSNKGWEIVYAVVSAAAIYTQLFCAFIVLAHAVSLLALPRESVPLRRVTKGWLILGLLVVPLGCYLVLRNPPNVDWIAPLTARDLRVYVGYLTGSRFNAAVVGIALGVCVLTVGARLITSGRSRAAWIGKLCVALLAVPVVAAAAVSLVKPLFVTRYLIVTVPGFALSLGVVIDRLRRQSLLAVLSVIVIIGALSHRAIDRAFAPRSREDLRAAAEFVAARYRPGDAIVLPETFFGFAYYAAADPRLEDAENVWPGYRWDAPYVQIHSGDEPLRGAPSSRTWVVIRGKRDVLFDGSWRPDEAPQFGERVREEDVEVGARLDGATVFLYEPASSRQSGIRAPHDA